MTYIENPKEKLAGLFNLNKSHRRKKKLEYSDLRNYSSHGISWILRELKDLNRCCSKSLQVEVTSSRLIRLPEDGLQSQEFSIGSLTGILLLSTEMLSWSCFTTSLFFPLFELASLLVYCLPQYIAFKWG